MNILENQSLLAYNTFGINVFARYFFSFHQKEELKIFLADEILRDMRMLVVGQGSNLLFLKDFDGIIVHSEMKDIQIIDQDDTFVILKAGSGVIWDDLVAYAVENGWGGIENLSLIPGETGAAAVQNIGAYGSEICDVIQKVEAIAVEDGQVRVFNLDECNYGYRESVFKKELKGKYIITSVEIKLSKKPVYKLDYSHLNEEVLKRGEINLQNIRNTVIDIRSSKLPDPKELGNAGSFFMNPVIDKMVYENLKLNYPNIPHYVVSENQVKVPAGWLIDTAGWKGKNVGNAGVHKNQALVLVNLGGANGQEIKSLAEAIQKDILDKFGIFLQPEVNFI